MTDDVIDAEHEEIDMTLSDNLPAVRAHEAVIARGQLTVDDLVAQAQKIRDVMGAAMKEGVHYGRIPGVKNPTLFKPGAELINVLLRLAPTYESEKVFHDDGHLTVISKCSLVHIPTGLLIAEGEGLCTSRENRYAFRSGGRICPECGQAAIIQGKAEYGGGWICFKKKDGCGAKFADGTEQASTFMTAETGKTPNPDLPDTWNTVLKMADKRAMVAACLNGTGASDVFTQDIEDGVVGDGPGASGAPEPEPQQRLFDPSLDKLPNAPSGWRAVADTLKEIEPSIDWTPMVSQATAHVFDGVDSPSKLDAKGKKQAGLRLGNVAARLLETRENLGDAEPLTDEMIQTAFAEMFGGVVVDVPTE